MQTDPATGVAACLPNGRAEHSDARSAPNGVGLLRAFIAESCSRNQLQVLIHVAFMDKSLLQGCANPMIG